MKINCDIRKSLLIETSNGDEEYSHDAHWGQSVTKNNTSKKWKKMYVWPFLR